MALDKFRLIEEVRKRPLLWNFTYGIPRNLKESDELWKEIGQVINANELYCKHSWAKLRAQFCNESYRIPIRIAKAKQTHSYDPNRKYYTWAYYDALKFVAKGLSAKAKFNPNFDTDSDSDIEIIENNSTDQRKPHYLDSNSYQTESDNDIEIVEADNLDPMQTQKQKYFENYYESDNDIAIVENNLDQTQCLQENYFNNDNTAPIIPVDDPDGSKPEDTNFKSYTVSINDCVQEKVCGTVSNDNTTLQTDAIIKEEPELQIKAEEDNLENENNEFQNDNSSRVSAAEQDENPTLLLTPKEEQHNYLEEFMSSPPAAPFPVEQISSSPGLNDQDYAFLYSFLSQTKVMTQLQKMEFRVNMKNLLVNIFPASASVNILEKQLLLPEDNDPDRKFLISFWPFIKSMSLMQNLQFRAKMSELVLQISLSGDIS